MHETSFPDSRTARGEMDRAIADRTLAQLAQDHRIRRRVGYLIATPPIIGVTLLTFIAVLWGITDDIKASGTTSTALVVAGALILVPTVTAAWRGTSVAAEHAQAVYESVEQIAGRSDSEHRSET